MHNALSVFKANVASVRDLATLHEYLCSNLKSPMTFDDLLRFQLVYSVSALDKLVHDVVRIGMVQIFTGARPATSKYLAERISMNALTRIESATIPPKEYYFEQEIVNKLKTVTYQSPDNIADGLSYIWDEQHKWQRIATAMAVTEDQARVQLKLIVDRRNKIAHEADLDILSGQKFSISKLDCESSVNFIEKCGTEIVGLVA